MSGRTREVPAYVPSQWYHRRMSTALAHPNIALIKYWGNRDNNLRLPANGSILINLEGLFARTSVTFDSSLRGDALTINGRGVSGKGLDRVSFILDLVRATAEVTPPDSADPHRMGIAPAGAVPAALEKAGLQLEQMDLIEINEAFAGQVLSVGAKLGWDWNKVNANGSAIALGHPMGSSGCRIVGPLVHKMKWRESRYGIATLCAEGGQGSALVVERLT